MVLLLALSLCAAASKTPQIVNADFETVNPRSATPSGWLFTSLPGQSQLVSYQSLLEPEVNGSRVLAIKVATDHPQQRVAYNAHQDLQGFQAGKTYRVTARVRTRSLQSLPMVVVQCLDQSKQKPLGFARSEQRELKQDLAEWETIQTVIQVPEGTATLRLRIGIPAEGNAGGTALIDDVQVVEVP
ncbi:hypothetical protein CA11_00380 [Gimesia maris]|uniref:hypothetical protein n=1 Tax=Gimesia maris TaxID=122 RepID=UPI00118AF4F2|nr:hypothetical protein [Gimesia maris]QDU12261.1 hypothetical protein CA11_00380 [Gimesia maris]